MACRKKHPFPKIGGKYGEWVVLAIPNKAGTRTRVPCQCSCGNGGTVFIWNLISGRSTCCKSCGNKTLASVTAQRRAVVAATASRTRYDFIPTLHRIRLRDRVNAAVRRCADPKCHNYTRYGGRGISVCPAWREDRTLFAKYLMTLDGWDNPTLQIDRINNDGNYEPGNVRFVTQTENRRNRTDYQEVQSDE